MNFIIIRRIVTMTVADSEVNALENKSLAAAPSSVFSAITHNNRAVFVTEL